MNTTGPINYAPPVTEDQRGRINKYPVCQTQEGNAGRVDGHQAPTTEPIAQLGLILVRTRCTIDATTVETVEVEIGLSVPTDPAIENDATVVFPKRHPPHTCMHTFRVFPFCACPNRKQNEGWDAHHPIIVFAEGGRKQAASSHGREHRSASVGGGRNTRRAQQKWVYAGERWHPGRDGGSAPHYRPSYGCHRNGKEDGQVRTCVCFPANQINTVTLCICACEVCLQEEVRYLVLLWWWVDSLRGKFMFFLRWV